MADPFHPLPFLRSLEPFGSWGQDPTTADSLADLAERAEIWRFSEGDLVRFPDEASPGPTWVAEGCLVVLEEKSPRYIGVREPLLAPEGVWIRGQTAGRFVTIPEASWQAWLRRFPTAALKLNQPVPPPLPRSLIRSPLVLEPGEIPYHLFRKAPLFVFLRAAIPAIFFLMFLTFGLTLHFGLAPNAPFWAVWLLPGLGMLITAALMVLVVWEWAASVLVITDRSILVRQIDLWAHRSDFEKLALERLREAVFTKRGWIDALLRLVTLEVEGDSPKGRLLFQGLSQNSRFLTAMESLRIRRVAAAPGRQVIRRSLAERAGGARIPQLEKAAKHIEQPGPKVTRLSWRIEKDSAVWFRRHPWIVVQKSLPWLGWTALLVFVAAFAAGLWPQGVWTITGVALVLGLVPLCAIGWEIVDWANDRLTIQGEKVILLHRRPLWLGEVRQEGTLDQVQQVGVRKENLVALLLDFGNVTVSLGASQPLMFEHANHPEWVQNEIFYRRTLMNQDRESKAARSRLDEVSEILDTWDEARKAGYFQQKNEKEQI